MDLQGVRIDSPSGLSIQVNANGSIRRMDHRDILINLFLGTEFEGGPANLYLRRHASSIETVPLLGPSSPAAFHFEKGGVFAEGNWEGINFHLSLVTAESAPAWFWHVALKNTGSTVEKLDLIYTQDLGLARYSAVRVNEFYVSHYVDHTALSHLERGYVLASRQNLSMEGRNPWTMIGALGRGVGYATDALQFHGLATRAGYAPKGLIEGLYSARLQHEHSMAAIQDASVALEPRGEAERGFFGLFEAHHPAATSTADLAFVDKVMGLPEASPKYDRSAVAGRSPTATLFSSAPLLEVLDLTETEIADLFGGEHRHEERVEGRLLSFFLGARRHVVLKEKELKVLRPHVHILRTGDRLVPDEASLTSTAWMGGIFHSMVTQGHVGINRFLSTVHGYLGLLRGNGLRIFVEMGGGWHLLGVPSAYEMRPQGCRWIYRHRSGLLVVRSEAPTERHELTLSVEVLSGPPIRLLLSHHVAINGDDGSEAVPIRYSREKDGVLVRPLPDSEVGRRFPEGGFLVRPLPGTEIERLGGDELLFADGRSRNQPFLCIITVPGASAGFRMEGRLISPRTVETSGTDEDRFWTDLTDGLRLHPPTDSPLRETAARFVEILPWFIQNVLVHYLNPRGVEQYTGGGWGTRDICQGPVEMLLALGRFDPLRELLIRVFKAQNPNGDWPQWFTFFERERNLRAADSHGDIVFWPIVALSDYLLSSEDGTLLDEEVTFFHPDGEEWAEKVSVWHHVERALAVIGKRVISGTRLAAYGHGDWNDSLQPVRPEMRENLCSAWTVTLYYQALTSLIKALNRIGAGDRAAGLNSKALEIREDFNRLLIVDGTLAGFAHFLRDGSVDYLFHPRDRTTGLSYRLLPMIHAVINDLFTPQQAHDHLRLIREHLLGPDGARLFDRPLEYLGGLQRYFQRAESAAFFGREIGLMYTHAHLRYTEALARYGDAEGFFSALSQANPIGIREVTPTAALRQANCYYSSSDAAFADRYQASAQYDRVKNGEIPLDGGWRVYSSGPGIWTRLFHQRFLGLRREKSRLVIDPVMPRSLDGLKVEMKLAGRMVEILYRIQSSDCGPTAVTLNNEELPFTREANPYRTGAAEIRMEELGRRFSDGVNRLTVSLG